MPNQFNSPEGDLENYFVSEYWLIDQYVGDQLWGWGANNLEGRVGNNSPTGTGSISTPVTTSAGGSNWKQVSTSFTNSLAIKTDGTLWVWGRNGNTQLGIFIGGLVRTCVSTPVTTFVGGTDWKQCSSGGYSSAAIKTDGSLWTWGAGSSGELGNNVTTAGASNRCTPVTTFIGGNNWKQVSCGTQFMAAVKTDGTLWTWGNNAHGTLGINLLGVATSRCTPVTTFVGGTNWKQVSCGVLNSSLLALGVGILTATSAAAIKTDGTLWTWGSNSLGQLGINLATAGTNARCTPVTTFVGGTNWKSVSSGGGAMAAIKTDGTLWTWGNNSGNLGDNTITSKNTPVTTFAGGTNWKSVAAGIIRTSAIKTDGTLWVWGNNSYVTLGTLSNQVFVCTPVTTFAGGTNWKQVSGGLFTSHAITSGTDPTSFVS